MLDVSDIVAILSSLYETISVWEYVNKFISLFPLLSHHQSYSSFIIQAANPTTVNVPLCLDLTLNWLLNVYDWWETLVMTNVFLCVLKSRHIIQTKSQVRIALQHCYDCPFKSCLSNPLILTYVYCIMQSIWQR